MAEETCLRNPYIFVSAFKNLLSWKTLMALGFDLVTANFEA